MAGNKYFAYFAFIFSFTMSEPDFLKSLKPMHGFFIGIDSDGCVFDSMEVKQKNFFIPAALRIFGLEPVSGILRKTWEFINLYSIHRGGNRFVSLVKVLDLLEKNELVRRSGVVLPGSKGLREWVKTETRLGNDTLREYLSRNPDPELGRILFWSETINAEIAEHFRDVPPFPHAEEAIRKISVKADLVIVSQTPVEALRREWLENGLAELVRAIAGQEQGSKSQQLERAAAGKYQGENILMIGDAIGDLEAARNQGICFFPIIPGKEDESWKMFIAEGSARFFSRTFTGDYQERLTGLFLASLPDSFS